MSQSTALAVLTAPKRPPVDAVPRPVLRRLLPPLAAMLALLVVGAGSLLLQLHQRQLAESLRHVAALVSDDLRVILTEQTDGLLTAVQTIAADPRVRSALRARSSERLLADWSPVYETLRRDRGLTHLYFLDPLRVCLLRVHAPQKRGDLIDRVTAREAERTGRYASGLELGPLGTLTLRVVQPVFDDDGAPLGYVELGKEIEDVLQELHLHSGSELAALIRKDLLKREPWEEGMRLLGREPDWDRLPHSVAIFASQGRVPDAVAELADRHFAADHPHGQIDREIDLDGRPTRVSAIALVDASSREVGDLLAMHDIGPERRAFAQSLILGGAGGAVLLGLLLGFVVTLLRGTDRAIRRQQAALREIERLFSAGPVFSIVWGACEHWPVLQVSENVASILGYTASEMTEADCRYTELIHPQDRARVMREMAERIARGEDNFAQSYRIETKRGGYRWFYNFFMVVRGDAGGVDSIRGYLFDQSEMKEAQIALERERQRLAGILRGTRAGTWEWNLVTGEVVLNARWAEIAGYTLDELRPLSVDTWRALCHPQDLKVSDDLLHRHFRGEIDYYECELRMRHKDGSWVWVQDRARVATWTENGKPLWVLGTHQDITALKEQQRQLERIAHHDVLTSLPNRVLLVERLYQAMARSRRRAQTTAVAHLDLDGFKAVNDDYGREIGDLVLVAVAARMQESLRDGDMLARVGGDEFAAVLGDLPNREACIPLLKRLLAAAAEPVTVAGAVFQVSASAGVTFYPQTDPADADRLLRQADRGMYQAKLAGKNGYHIFDPERDRSVRGRHESPERMRKALTEGELVLYYQPKANLRTGTVVGTEALIRWHHPERGLLLPEAFLPPIEDHPLAVELGEWVIEAALAQQERWRSQGLALPISVNVGARQLQQASFVERLRGQLAAHPDLPPGCLEIELLETSALGDLSRISQVIADCQALGVRCALDDFGTGYSSLTYLKRLPVGLLKIDRTFVRDMLEDPEDLAIVESVLGLARAFRREVIAEGVEASAHAELLLQLGCELAQGYGIARPMPAEDVPDWCLAWRPDARWERVGAVSRDDLALIRAGVEHRAWVASVEKYLLGERNLLPLDSGRCRFGYWLDQQASIRRRRRPVLREIHALHRKVHGMAETLVRDRSRGRNSDALARLEELRGLRDALLERLASVLAPPAG